MSPMELIFDFFEDHTRAALGVSHQRPLALGIMGFIVGACSYFVTAAVCGKLVLLSFGWLSLIWTVLWELAMGFVLVACLHLISDMQGFKGDAVELFVLFGLADMVWAAALPVILILMALFPGSGLAVTLAFFVMGFFSLSLKARSLQDVYHVSLGRSWMTLILPYLATLLASLLALSLIVAGLFMSLMKVFD